MHSDVKNMATYGSKPLLTFSSIAFIMVQNPSENKIKTAFSKKGPNSFLCSVGSLLQRQKIKIDCKWKTKLFLTEQKKGQ